MVHLHLHLSSSVYIFRHNCLLTDLAYLHMTCHNYNGHMRRGLIIPMPAYWRWDRRAAISGTLDIAVVLYKYFVMYNKFHLSYFFSYFFIIVSSFNYLLLLCIGIYSPFQICKIKIKYCKWIERGYRYIFHVKSSNCTILNVSAVIYVICYICSCTIWK